MNKKPNGLIFDVPWTTNDYGIPMTAVGSSTSCSLYVLFTVAKNNLGVLVAMSHKKGVTEL